MIKHFSHTDLDGYSCILLSQLAYGIDTVSFDTCSHHEINDKVATYLEEKHYLEYEHCYITDIGISESLAQTIEDLVHAENSDLSADHFKLFDHHISAISLNTYSWCQVMVADTHETKCCGTTLIYQHLKDVQPSPLLTSDLTATYVEKVRRLDTWDWDILQDIEAKQLNDLFFILGSERFMTYWLERLIENNSNFGFNPTHELILDIRQNEIDNYIDARNDELIEKEILGFKAGIVFANRFQSELGNKLSERHPELDFIAMINVGGGVSLRTTREDINLATDITEVFGGGGHAKAAGMRVPSAIRDMVIDTLFCLNEESIF